MSEPTAAPAEPTPDAVIDPPPSAGQVLHDVEADAQQAARDTSAGLSQIVETDKADLHPAVAEVLQFFDPAHLREDLAAIARPFQALAHKLAAQLRGSQLTLALHNLLASKDAAVRAKVAADSGSAEVAPTNEAPPTA